MKSIAVIGTGIMGSGIAVNFLQNGYKVFVWNRDKKKLGNLIAKGAIQVNSPKEAANRAEIIFEVTANDQSSRSVWTGKKGIIAGATPQKFLFTNATLSISWTNKLIVLSRQKNLNFYDLPMTGGRAGAESGKLILLAGCSSLDLKNIAEDLSAISEKIIYFGKQGDGMKFKLLLNTLQAIHIMAFGEVMNIAEKLGLNVQMTGDSLAERPGGTATKIAWRDYQKPPDPINFSIDWITKDLKYTKKSTKYIDTPLLDKVLKKYRKAIALKMGQKDWTAINLK